MRLNESEIKIIKEVIENSVKEAKIYLFGSRLDDNKKGGDIDLFLIADDINYEKKIQIKAKLKNMLHKPIDIVYHQNFEREIEKEALRGTLL